MINPHERCRMRGMNKNGLANVAGQEDLGSGYFVMRLDGPRVAEAAKAGQFVMLGLPDVGQMLIRRPFSVARVGPASSGAAPEYFEILYKVVGRYTHAFSQLKAGSPVTVLGPLGRGFWHPTQPLNTELFLVAGGIGVAPFPLLLQQTLGVRENTTLLIGGRGVEDLVLLPWFESHCGSVVPVTEDGTLGRRGLVTEALLESLDRPSLKERWVLACGPKGMLKAVSRLCLDRDIPCQLALEETMACGFGVCLGCVVPKRRPLGEFDRFVRVCKEGPVFDAREIEL